MATPSKTVALKEIGQGGKNTRDGHFRSDEFQRDLKGKKSIRKFREMRDNDSTIGAVMYATEQVLRDVPWEIKVPDDLPEGKKADAEEKAKWLKTVFDDMECSLDDHISEALSSLSYGFALFEVVYKRRVGPTEKNPKKKSKYTDGYIGIRKLASRAQWNIDRFDIDVNTGEINGVWQESVWGTKGTYIPYSKLLHYRTTNLNADPAGRSILRNAYKSYTYLTNLQAIEAIAVERELHGIPVGRMPAEYLSSEASADQRSLREAFETALRDVKLNEQGYILLPSDLQMDSEGNFGGGVGARLMDIELISSNGTRNIEIDPIIKRYQHDIARSVMAEFLMLGGSGSMGSYALSKSKTDLFLRSMESYINSIFDVLNKQLIEKLWELNGFDVEVMPKMVAGDVAPHDIREIAAFLRNLNGADINVADHPETVENLFNIVDLDFDREAYEEEIKERKAQQEEMRQAQLNPPQVPQQGEPNEPPVGS